MMRMNKRWIGCSVAAGLIMLTGCSTVSQMVGGEESVNYKSTVAGDPLSIPPDLTQAGGGAHYRAPEGVATYNQYAQAQQNQGGSAAERILPVQSGIDVRRDGDIRWLV